MGDLGARDGFLFAYEVQDDLTIDIADGIGAGNIRFFEVYASQCFGSKSELGR